MSGFDTAKVDAAFFPDGKVKSNFLVNLLLILSARAMARLFARENPESPPGTARSAFMVGAGILSSRLAELIRDRVFAHYFGNSDAADAFRPNFLQTLFGEGVLSASPLFASVLAFGVPEAHDAWGRVRGRMGV
jgi:hypothetical protein